MGWENLVNEIDKKFSYLTKVKASRNGLRPSIPHPVLRFSAGLVISAIFDEKSNRIVLLFPNRFNLDKWIAVLSVLELLKIDYNKKKPNFSEFRPGQKLLLNNKYVVEFEGIAEGKIWIKTSDTSSRIGLNLGRMLQFQPTTRKRLSPIKKVWSEYSNAPRVSIDSILDIYTAGNKSLFSSNIIFVGRTGKSVEFINNTEINKTRLIDLFLWGKLNAEGNISIVSTGGVQALPSCLIASDLYSAVNYFNFDENKSRAIVLSSISFGKNDPQSFNALLDSKIPIIVIADFNDLDDLESLREDGFKIWQWNEKNLIEISKQYQSYENSIFTPFHRTLTNLCNQKTEIVSCYYPELDSITDELIIFEKKIQPEYGQLKSSFSQLFQLHNEFSRLIRFPSEKWLSNFREKINNVQDQFESQRLWISTETMNQLNQIITSLLEISENPFLCENQKLDQLEKLFQENSISGKTIVIIPRYEDVEETRSYWQKRFAKSSEKLTNVVFMAAGDLSIESLNSAPQRIIVSGWLGQNVMYSILHSFLTDKIILLAYSKEATWYKRATNRWRRKRKFKSNLNDFQELLNFPTESLDPFDSAIEEGPEQTEESPEENIVELELRLKQYRYSGYKASDNSIDVIEKAKPVVFNDERFALFTKTHKCLVVTDLILNTNPGGEIQKLTPGDLNIGDYILFFSSDKDLIREIADKILIAREKADLRTRATFWKYLLRKRTEEMPFNAVVSILRRHGCKRHETTIKNWLMDEDIIGPANSEDVKIILTSFTSPLKRGNLDALINEIYQAISEVRGAHHQAASFLTEQLIAKLPDIIPQEVGIGKPLIIDLPEFGRVFILRIEEIENQWIEVEKYNTNRLLEA